MKITRIAPSNEAGFEVLAQNDWPEIFAGENTIAILFDAGYRIVMSPADAMGLAQMARLASTYPESRLAPRDSESPSETDAGGRLPAHKRQPPTSA